MIIRYFKSRKDWSSLVRDNFRKSLESYLEFLKIAEQRALSVSPDHKVAWQNAFSFQRLVKKRQVLRFEFLLKNDMFDSKTISSVAAIEERLDRIWDETEETVLRNSMRAYAEIAREIDAIEAIADPNALDGPRRVLEEDREYCDARRALSERARERQIQLAQFRKNK
jgi:hypothetical protein